MVAAGIDLIYEGIATYRVFCHFPILSPLAGIDLIYEGIATLPSERPNASLSSASRN